MTWLRRTSLACALLLTACGAAAEDGSVSTDAGGKADSRVDSGTTTADTGSKDSSTSPVDSALDDTGASAADTSPAVDATPCDATTCGGACVDLKTDPNNCGACDKKCATGEACTAGACAPAVCGAGTFSCSGKCVELTSDPANCGSCGKKCAADEVCKFASCDKVCTAPATKCFGECVDMTTSATNCGACGKTCGTGESCLASACVCGTRKCELYEVCSAGSCSCTKTTCGTKCTDTSSDSANCGTCGKTCATGVACVAGACVTSTTATFPLTTSTTTGGGTLGTGGGGSFYQTGDYVEDKVARTSPVTKIDLAIRMDDQTDSYCAVGTLTWAVKINGTTVGTYSFVGGSSFGDRTINETYSFAAITPISGQLTIRLEALTTVCSGGSSWNWYPGGTVTMY